MESPTWVNSSVVNLHRSPWGQQSFVAPTALLQCSPPLGQAQPAPPVPQGTPLGQHEPPQQCSFVSQHWISPLRDPRQIFAPVLLQTQSPPTHDAPRSDGQQVPGPLQSLPGRQAAPTQHEPESQQVGDCGQ
jgi:hypothetical protein